MTGYEELENDLKRSINNWLEGFNELIVETSDRAYQQGFEHGLEWARKQDDKRN